MTLPNASLDELIAALSDLPVPDADGDRAGLGPLYDNLVGAHYALFEAEAIWKESGGVIDYDRKKVVEEMPGYREDNKREGADLRAWRFGFYRNSAIHRIVWVRERAAKLLIGENERITKKLYKKAKKCSQENSLISLDVIFEQNCSLTPINKTNIFIILGKVLNAQKHEPMGIKSQDSEDSDTIDTWFKLSGERHIQYVTMALDVISEGYRELYLWRSRSK